MLGEKIKEKRLELGYSIKELSFGTMVDSSLLSRIEKGSRAATITQLKSITDFLKIEMTEYIKYWLEDKVIDVINTYPEYASEVLIAAESRIEYMSSKRNLKETEIPKSILSKLIKIDELKNNWKLNKPLNSTVMGKLKDYFSTNYTYESNRIEGNTLTMQETFFVVQEGLTIGGKSMTEHLEAINHHEAIELMYDLAQYKTPFIEYTLKQIHNIVLRGIDTRNAGKYRNIQVRIGGSKHIPPEPYLLPKLMEDYFLFYELEKNRMHPVLLAAEMHERLVSIHPFIDGNGRTARLIMNLILLMNGYSIAILKGSNASRIKYYSALENVQVNNNSLPFYKLVIKECENSLLEHLKLC